MSAKEEPSLIQKFLLSTKQFPILAAIAAGLYPILFYFTNNYTIVGSWGHVRYFLFFFLVLPSVVFYLLYKIFQFNPISKWKKSILPFLNAFTFLFFMTVCYFGGIHHKAIALAFVLSLVYGLFLYSFYKKGIIIQLLLALIGVFSLGQRMIKLSGYSANWLKQPDQIEQVVFKTKPNIYFIQPDGYANFSELKNNKYYQIDNGEFEGFLKKSNFKYYNNFRTNYPTTLASNGSVFGMKHHYLFKAISYGELPKMRNVIVSDNPVLTILKNNGYSTHLLVEQPYLLLSKPQLNYNTSNFSLENISYIGTGLGEQMDIISPFSDLLEEPSDKPKFFFLEIFNPRHISNKKGQSKGEKKERELWEESMQIANNKLTKIIEIIKEKDPNALVIIMADHGGYVGFDYTNQTYKVTKDRDLIYSIFTSTLAIHWPDNKAPEFDTELKSPVNIFRIVFAYLSEEESFLDELQPNESFVILKDNEIKGVYKYIDDQGKVTLEKK